MARNESGHNYKISVAFLMLWMAQRTICYGILMMKWKLTRQIQDGTHMMTLSSVKIQVVLDKLFAADN
jgi:hypothetical protein